MREKEYPGTFIVIEGADGSGTTTQSKKLAEEIGGYYTFEPSGNSIGEKVDELISSEQYSPETVALGFAADRMVHLEEEIIPRLEDGEVVVCDRYYHSSMVYQPTMGLDFEWVKQLNKAALTPDLTFVLDVSADIGMSRVDSRGRDGNVFEQMSFQEEVVARYRDLDNKLDEKIIVIDSRDSIQEVSEKISLEIKKLSEL